MLVAAGLVLALRTAACPDGYEIRSYTSYGGLHTTCANATDYSNVLTYESFATPAKTLLCSPATPNTPCCLSALTVEGFVHGDGIYCVPSSDVNPGALFENGWAYADAPALQCNQDVYSTIFERTNQKFQLDSVDCTSVLQPAPLAEEAGLSAGATAGIVVGGILGPFALGLAYKTLM